MPFCQECGSRLEAGSKYCTECGEPFTPVPDDSAVSPDAPGQADESSEDLPAAEKVIAIIPNLMRVRGLGIFLKGPVWHHMVVTPQRIILVRRTVEGLERFKQDIGIIGPDYEYPLMKSMQPGKILDEYPESLVIPQKDIITMTVTKYTTYDAEEGTHYYWQVEIATNKQILTLRTDYDEDPGEYFRNPPLIELFRERLVLGDR